MRKLGRLISAQLTAAEQSKLMKVRILLRSEKLQIKRRLKKKKLYLRIKFIDPFVLCFLKCRPQFLL